MDGTCASVDREYRNTPTRDKRLFNWFIVHQNQTSSCGFDATEPAHAEIGISRRGEWNMLELQTQFEFILTFSEIGYRAHSTHSNFVEEIIKRNEIALKSQK